MNIRRARKEDALAILDITHKAFFDYQQNLSASSPLTAALKENIDDVLCDIENNRIFVAQKDNHILGAIRFMFLSKELAYVYRFGVDPQIKNKGVGSGLLEAVIEDCSKQGVLAIALHTNSKYYKLARYYYGKEFFVHSTETSKGYIRALFIKELAQNAMVDLAPAFKK